jgi:Mn2+/Fe2+ NRAMP family transporter
MNTTALEPEHQESAKHVETIEIEPSQSTEAPEISRGAWRVIIFMLVGAVVMLGTIAVYVFSGLHRYQGL